MKVNGIKQHLDLEAFDKDGYMVVKNVLTDGQLKTYRAACESMFQQKYMEFNDGKVIPGWAGRLREIGPLNNLHKHPRLITLVTSVLGPDWVYAEHSDLHENKITNWHTDILPERLAHFQDKNPYDPGYKIIKICILLQDHTDNEHGLWMRPGSHKVEANKFKNKGGDEFQDVCIKSGPKDAIVFDQKIMHRGQLSQYKEIYGKDRYLITYGYGLNNIYTRQHAAGTIYRQNQQRFEIAKSNGQAKWSQSVNQNPGGDVEI